MATHWQLSLSSHSRVDPSHQITPGLCLDSNNRPGNFQSRENSHGHVWNAGNHHMKTVRVGRHTAVSPEEDGSFVRSPGQSVGGSRMCLIILSRKCNQ
jgi:hypothetical protein